MSTRRCDVLQESKFSPRINSYRLKLIQWFPSQHSIPLDCASASAIEIGNSQIFGIFIPVTLACIFKLLRIGGTKTAYIKCNYSQIQTALYCQTEATLPVTSTLYILLGHVGFGPESLIKMYLI